MKISGTRLALALFASAGVSVSGARAGSGIYIPIPAATHPKKALFLKEAARLFAETHPEAKVVAEDSPKSQAALFQSLSEKLRKGMTVFSPADSGLAGKFADHLDGSSQERPIYGQVIASTSVHDRISLKSLFFPSIHYLRGISGLLKERKFPRESAIYLFLEDEHSYFGETADAALAELKSSGYTRAKLVKLKKGGLKAAWEAESPPEGSAVIYLVSNAGAAALKELGPVTGGYTRIFPYGKIGSPSSTEAFLPGTLAKGAEIHALYWSPHWEMGHGKLSSCAFVRDYRSKFRRTPDLHAAFLYASLEEIVSGKSPSATITGLPVYDEKGIRVDLRPIYLEITENRKTVYLPAGLGRPCTDEASRRYLKGLKVRKLKAAP